MNLDSARHNMVEQQIRPWDVIDQRVLDALAELPRERFISHEFNDLAYADVEIPLSNGELATLPRLAARLAQALQLKPTDKVLEIGTGSGFVTALLARLAGHVYSVNRDPEQLRLAARSLADAGIPNVTLLEGDGAGGWPGQAPYDAIAITGSLPSLEKHWLEQLAVGGRLFAVLGSGHAMEATLVTRVGPGEIGREGLFETELPALLGQEAAPRFDF